MPASIKTSLGPKLARLREQSDDMMAGVVRTDPFDVLPLELIVHIMQIGLEDDRDLVLKSRFVSKKWNNTLVHECPEIWRTLIFRSRQSARDKEHKDKFATWLTWSKENLHTVEFLDGMTSSGMTTLLEDTRLDFDNIRTFRLAMDDNKALYRFTFGWGEMLKKVEQLHIDGRDTEVYPYEVETYTDLHCRLLDPVADKGLKTMEVMNIDFRDRHLDHYNSIQGMRSRRLKQAASRKRRYPALESLIVYGCNFDTFGNRRMPEWINGDVDPDSDDETGARIKDFEPVNARYKACQLHVSLRATPNLQDCLPFKDCRPPLCHNPGTATPISRIELRKVICLTVPPITAWTVDISTPNVESLSFALVNDFMRDDYYTLMKPGRPHWTRFPALIPLPQESPVDIDNLLERTHLGVECNRANTIDRLEAWLSQVPNLASLSIHGNKTTASSAQSLQRRSEGNTTYRSYPVSVILLKALIDHPEWTEKSTRSKSPNATCLMNTSPHSSKRRRGRHHWSRWSCEAATSYLRRRMLGSTTKPLGHPMAKLALCTIWERIQHTPQKASANLYEVKPM